MFRFLDNQKNEFESLVIYRKGGKNPIFIIKHSKKTYDYFIVISFMATGVAFFFAFVEGFFSFPQNLFIMDT